MIKQHALTLLTFGLLSTSIIQAQNDPIAQIKMQYAAIEGTKNLKKVSFSAEVPGGELDIAQFLQADGTLKKLVLNLSSEHYSATETYYYNNGQVFFVFETQYSWRFSAKSTPEKPVTLDSAFQYRYYVHNGQVIKLLEKTAQPEQGDKLNALLSKAANKAQKVEKIHHRKLIKAQVLPLVSSSKELEKFANIPW